MHITKHKYMCVRCGKRVKSDGHASCALRLQQTDGTKHKVSVNFYCVRQGHTQYTEWRRGAVVGLGSR